MNLKNRILGGLGLAASLWLLTSCGSSSSTSNPVPTPTPATGSNGSLSTNPPTATSGVPDLTNAAAIQLTDPTYGGLRAVFGAIFEPVVGDPKLLLNYTIGKNYANQIDGTLTIAVEDYKGLHWIDQNTVNYGTRGYGAVSFTNGQYTNIVYSDSYQTLAILIGYQDSGATIYGNINYRTRQSGENSCLPYSIQCTQTVNGVTTTVTCPQSTIDQADQNHATDCRNYAYGSGVTSLGNFTVPRGNFEN